MIIIALGSNLAGPWGDPSETIARAFHELEKPLLKLVLRSSLIVTPPFGLADQPDYINAAAIVETALSPESLMERLHLIERDAGRQRGVRWGPRMLDLDLIDYHGLVRSDPETQLKQLVLPHPGAATRDFVLKPIAEIAPEWRHPVLQKTAAELLG
jgi:2-amino-4-hydroxy-6-hydroxymethyldihydropteridine diphosphokinase